MARWQNIPDDVLPIIGGHLMPRDLIALASVNCKSHRDLKNSAKWDYARQYLCEYMMLSNPVLRKRLGRRKRTPTSAKLYKNLSGYYKPTDRIVFIYRDKPPQFRRTYCEDICDGRCFALPIHASQHEIVEWKRVWRPVTHPTSWFPFTLPEGTPTWCG